MRKVKIIQDLQARAMLSTSARQRFRLDPKRQTVAALALLFLTGMPRLCIFIPRSHKSLVPVVWSAPRKQKYCPRAHWPSRCETWRNCRLKKKKVNMKQQQRTIKPTGREPTHHFAHFQFNPGWLKVKLFNFCYFHFEKQDPIISTFKCGWTPIKRARFKHYTTHWGGYITIIETYFREIGFTLEWTTHQLDCSL